MLSKTSLLRELIFSKYLTLVRGMLMPLKNNFKGFIKKSKIFKNSGLMNEWVYVVDLIEQ